MLQQIFEVKILDLSKAILIYIFKQTLLSLQQKQTLWNNSLSPLNVTHLNYIS